MNLPRALMTTLLCWMASGTIAGCGDDGATPTGCTPGEQDACTCTDGSPGAQTCNGDGTAFDACVCTGSGSSVASSGSGGTGTGGTGGGTAACAPGAIEDCYEGPAGTEDVGPCAGGQRICAVDGTWGACMGQVLPAAEDCQTPADEDCDGETPTCAGGWALGLGNNSGVLHLGTDPLGNVFVTGYFDETLDFGGGNTLTDVGVADTFIAKLSPSGQFQWAHALGDPLDPVSPTGLAVDSQGNAYIAVTFQNNPTLLGEDLQSEGETDIALIKLAPDGMVDAVMSFGSMGYDAIYGMNVDADDNVVLAAFHGSAIYFGGNDVLMQPALALVKLSPSGGHIFSQNVLPGPGYPVGVDVDATTNDIYLASTFQGSVDPGMGSVNNRIDGDLFLARFNQNGSVLWYEATGGPQSNPYGATLTSDPAGGFVVSGRFTGLLEIGQATPVQSMSFSADVFIARYDGAGSLEWVNAYSSPGMTQTIHFSNVALAASGNLVVGGRTFGTTDLGGPSVTDASYRLELDPAGFYVTHEQHPMDLYFNALGLAPDGVTLVGGMYYGSPTFLGQTLPQSNAGAALVARMAP